MSEVLTKYRIHSAQISNVYQLERKATSLILRSALILDSVPKDLRLEQVHFYSNEFTNIKEEMGTKDTDDAALWVLDYSDLVLNSFQLCFSNKSGRRFLLRRHLPILVKSILVKLQNEHKRNLYVESILCASTKRKTS
jgi:hypothetical protein